MSPPPVRLCVISLLLPALMGLQTTRATPADARLRARGEAVVRDVRKRFFNEPLADAWAEKHKDYARAATDEASFTRLTRAALADLNASHVGYYTRDDPEYWAVRAIFGKAIGFESLEYEGVGVDVDGGGFARVVFAGGPAARAGVKRGDQILTVDGEHFHPIRSFRKKAGERLTLTVRRTAGGPVIELPVTPRRVDPTLEWIEHQIAGTRLIERGGKTIAYVPMFCGAGDHFEHALRRAVGGQVRDADALVIDFRYGWGGCSPSFVDVFHERRPTLAQFDRAGERIELDRPWAKPLYVLIGPGTRSGKEIVAHALRKHGRATLVGRPTAGAVLGGSPSVMPDGSLLMLPVVNVLVDGERLEGRPVKPDVEVRDVIEFAGDEDPVLDAALKLAVEARMPKTRTADE